MLPQQKAEITKLKMSQICNSTVRWRRDREREGEREREREGERGSGRDAFKRKSNQPQLAAPMGANRIKVESCVENLEGEIIIKLVVKKLGKMKERKIPFNRSYEVFSFTLKQRWATLRTLPRRVVYFIRLG